MPPKRKRKSTADEEEQALATAVPAEPALTAEEESILNAAKEAVLACKMVNEKPDAEQVVAESVLYDRAHGGITIQGLCFTVDCCHQIITNLITVGVPITTLFLDRKNSYNLTGPLLNCTSLRALSLKGNDLGSEGAKRVATNLTRASVAPLYIKSNKIDPESEKAYLIHSVATTDLVYSPFLKILDIGYNNIGKDGIRSFTPIFIHCREFTTLEAGYNNICAEGGKSLALALQHCQTLTSLNLRYNRLKAEGATALSAAFSHLPNLTHLDLMDNQIEADGANSLAQNFNYCRALQNLDLRYNKVGIIGAKAISANLEHCISLKSLDLKGGNEIGHEASLAIISALHSCSSLTKLDISNNFRMSEEETTTIREMLKNFQQITAFV